MKVPLSDQPCSSSPINFLLGSAESVVFPVPDKPKNNAVSPFSPMFAEQCIGKIPLSGKRKFITPNIDFFISPAYSVPPMRTIFLVKSIRIKISVLVPSISGSATKSLIHKIVNSGSCFSSSSFDGLMNKLLANMLCQT